MCRRLMTLCAFGLIFAGCSNLDISETDARSKNASALATFYDFVWSGVVETDNCFRPHMAIEQQLLYTVGQLNGYDSVGRLDQVELKNVQAEEGEDRCRITYEARMPVAWAGEEQEPADFTLILPRNLGWSAVDDFVTKYTETCVSAGAYDVDSGVFWYYYRPERIGCELEEQEVVRMVASLEPNAEASEGMYPEYDMVWEDDTLNVVAIFGKAKEDSEGYDGGINSFWNFTGLVEEELGASVTSVDADGEGESSSVVIRAQLQDGKKVNVYVFMIRSVDAADDDFWTRYASLTPTADYIVYNGHSGLGRNVRRLAREGAWQTGQYAIVFMNGCDTYAYIDAALAEAHAEVNPDDPEGTKYLDIVANAMPSYVSSTPQPQWRFFAA